MDVRHKCLSFMERFRNVCNLYHEIEPILRVQLALIVRLPSALSLSSARCRCDRMAHNTDMVFNVRLYTYAQMWFLYIFTNLGQVFETAHSLHFQETTILPLVRLKGRDFSFLKVSVAAVVGRHPPISIHPYS